MWVLGGGSDTASVEAAKPGVVWWYCGEREKGEGVVLFKPGSIKGWCGLGCVMGQKLGSGLGYGLDWIWFLDFTRTIFVIYQNLGVELGILPNCFQGCILPSCE